MTHHRHSRQSSHSLPQSRLCFAVKQSWLFGEIERSFADRFKHQFTTGAEGLTGHHEDRERRVGHYLLDCFEPIRARHLQVDHKHLRALLDDQLKHAFAIRRFTDNFNVTFKLKKAAKLETTDKRVVQNGYTEGAHEIFG